MATFTVPWKFLRIRLAIRPGSKMVGGVPANPNLISAWVKANMEKLGTSEAEQARIVAETKASVRTVEDAEKAMWTVFKEDEQGIYIEGRQVKSAFKEAANILRDALNKQDKKATGENKGKFTAFKSKLAEQLFVVNEKVYFERAGDFLKKADANEERAIHVETAQGPRNALKRTDVVYAEVASKGTVLSFIVKYLDTGLIDESLIRDVLLDYMGENGLGADRSQGNGKFNVVEVQPLAAFEATAHVKYGGKKG